PPTPGERLRRPRAGCIQPRGQGWPDQSSAEPRGGRKRARNPGAPLPGTPDTNQSASDLPTPRGDTFPPDGRASRIRPRSMPRPENGRRVVVLPARSEERRVGKEGRSGRWRRPDEKRVKRTEDSSSKLFHM